jgi:hypothetical protein
MAEGGRRQQPVIISDDDFGKSTLAGMKNGKPNNLIALISDDNIVIKDNPAF